MEKDGLFVDSAIAEALRTGSRSIKLVESFGEPSLLAVSTPVRDAKGKVRMVVTFSQDEETTLLIIRRFQKESEWLALVANYLSQSSGKNTIIYASNAIRDIVARLDRVSPTDATILFTGESGTGKEVFPDMSMKRAPAGISLLFL